MIIDTSALLAVIQREPECVALLRAMLDASRLSISAANWLEAFIVVRGRNVPGLEAALDALLADLKPDIVAVTAEQAAIARTASRDYGRGNHPARLNYGDCFAYALAKLTGEPLLFKGGDFSQTDIVPALRA